MFKDFSNYVYVLLDPGDTLYFATLLIARSLTSDILNEPFMVSTPVGELFVAKRVYSNFTIMIPNRVTYV